jgi:hypothetical protein
MPNPARTTVARLPLKGLHANPILGCGRNFPLFTVKAELPMLGWLQMIDCGKV